MKILLTGYPGWLSNKLIKSLSNKKFKIHTLSKLNCAKKNHYKVDIENREDIERIFIENKFDIVIHTAGLIHPKIFSKDLFNVNFTGTKNILDNAILNGCKCFIYLSSNAVYGINGEIYSCDEKVTSRPTSDYGKSKKIAENYIINNSRNSKYFILRPASFFGGTYPKKYLDKFKFIKKYFCLLPNKKIYKNFTSINLMIDTIIYLINNFSVNESGIFNVTNKGRMSLQEFHEVVAKKFNFKLKVIKLPSIFFTLFQLTDRIFSFMGIYIKNIHLLGEANWSTNINSNRIYKVLNKDYPLNYSKEIETQVLK